MLAADNITTRTTSSYGNQIGFTGRYLDKETGLWCFRARYYSGSLGRFVGGDFFPSSFGDKRPLVSLGLTDQATTDYFAGYNLYQATFVPGGVDPTGHEEVHTGEGQIALTKGRVEVKIYYDRWCVGAYPGEATTKVYRVETNFRGWFPDTVDLGLDSVEIYNEYETKNTSKKCPQKEPQGTWIETTVTVLFKEKIAIGIKIPYTLIGWQITIRDAVVGSYEFTFGKYCCCMKLDPE